MWWQEVFLTWKSLLNCCCLHQILVEQHFFINPNFLHWPLTAEMSLGTKQIWQSLRKQSTALRAMGGITEWNLTDIHCRKTRESGHANFFSLYSYGLGCNAILSVYNGHVVRFHFHIIRQIFFHSSLTFYGDLEEYYRVESVAFELRFNFYRV
jgi:hypothetical protein